VGAGLARDDHVARPLNRDAIDSAVVRCPARAGEAAARRGATHVGETIEDVPISVLRGGAATAVLDAAWRWFELTTYTTDAIGSSAAAALMRSHVVDAVLKAHNQRVARRATARADDDERGADRGWRTPSRASASGAHRYPRNAGPDFRGFKADRWDARGCWSRGLPR
jgi:hypothetical protein